MKTWVQIIIALLIGVALGFTFAGLKCKKCCGGPCAKKAAKHQMLDKFSKKLDLTEDQKTQVASIFEEKHNKMLELHKEKKNQIKEILTPEQQEKFNEFSQKWESHRGKCD